eukprot:841130-Amphidinium_carterae.1
METIVCKCNLHFRGNPWGEKMTCFESQKLPRSNLLLAVVFFLKEGLGCKHIKNETIKTHENAIQLHMHTHRSTLNTRPAQRATSNGPANAI